MKELSSRYLGGAVNKAKHNHMVDSYYNFLAVLLVTALCAMLAPAG